jgi:Ca2+-binding EF-hand superfamily protein
VDSDGNGVLNEVEFRSLLFDHMHVIDTQEEAAYLVQILDPFNNQKMTYSEIVHLLTSH